MIERLAALVLAFIVLLAGHVAITSTWLGSGHGTPRLVADTPGMQVKPAVPACKPES